MLYVKEVIEIHGQQFSNMWNIIAYKQSIITREPLLSLVFRGLIPLGTVWYNYDSGLPACFMMNIYIESHRELSLSFSNNLEIFPACNLTSTFIDGWFDTPPDFVNSRYPFQGHSLRAEPIL